MYVAGFIVAGGVVGLCALAFALWRERRESARLRGRLESAAEDLESLQRSFSRFAPASLHCFRRNV